MCALCCILRTAFKIVADIFFLCVEWIGVENKALKFKNQKK